MKADKFPAIGVKNLLAEELYQRNSGYSSSMPSVKATQRWVREMVNTLFPIRENLNFSLEAIDQALERLKLKLADLIIPLQKELNLNRVEIASLFFDQLKPVYATLMEDADTFIKSDPASENLEEVILCYPGFFALIVYRIAHVLYKMEVPVLPRIMTEYAHGKTGIDIHPGAVIGKKCFIDHGTGIVIGETTLVGNNVKIYQGVTLGALFVDKGLSDTKRHPTVEDNVILYAGCTILGGKTIIGHDTIIGGNVWLTESVLPSSIVYRDNRIVVRDKSATAAEINYII